MPENTFDIVSKIELPEVSNAIQQALKEIHTRFDLKDSKSNIELDGKDAIVLSAVDEYKLKAVNDILQQKLVKRGVSLKGLTYAQGRIRAGCDRPPEDHHAAGHPHREGQRDRKRLKDSKKKVQASIQGDLVRVSGKDRDSLQEIIALLKQKDLGIDMQFTNYRSN